MALTGSARFYVHTARTIAPAGRILRISVQGSNFGPRRKGTRDEIREEPHRDGTAAGRREDELGSESEPGDGSGSPLMAELIAQFEEASTRVEPDTADKENAASAHQEVREELEGFPFFQDAGVDTVLIGSYKRHVSIRRVKDVDVFSKLPDLAEDMGPRELLTRTVADLTTAFGNDRVEAQDRSVKVTFPDLGLDVDVVPARPQGAVWEIPNRSDAAEPWQATNPERLTELTTNMNQLRDDLYVPVVKLIRQTRRNLLGKDEKPGGFFFEVTTFHAFDAGLDGGNLPRLYVAALEATSALLDAHVHEGVVIEDPSLPGTPLSIRATAAQLEKAVSTWKDAATTARHALDTDDVCEAAALYRGLFGANEDGEQVFPWPAACNEDGTPKEHAGVRSGLQEVPAGDGRFA